MKTLFISLSIASFSFSVWANEPATQVAAYGSGSKTSMYSTQSDASSRHMALQQKWLFHPSRHQLERERGGAITIYDGMSDRHVQLAFDKAFDRIDHMMFVNVRKTGADGEILKDAKTGKAITFDDGC